MKMLGLTRTKRVRSAREREMVLTVLQVTYAAEKGWVDDAQMLFPPADLERADISWFIATKRGAPVGVLRVHYDPPIQQYLAYGLQPIGAAIDVQSLIANERIAEIGRFAVLPECRRSIDVGLGLMRSAAREIVERGCTQLVTDVFENDPHSPLGFHTRIAGFTPVATHEVGELRHMGRRITLLLNLKTAYRSLKARRDSFFRRITRGWSPSVHESMMT